MDPDKFIDASWWPLWFWLYSAVVVGGGVLAGCYGVWLIFTGQTPY